VQKILSIQNNIKSLLDQRPDEVTVIRNNQAQTVKAETVNIGEIIQLKSGEKLGLDGTLLSETASFNTSALTGESKPDTKFLSLCVGNFNSVRLFRWNWCSKSQLNFGERKQLFRCIGFCSKCDNGQNITLAFVEEVEWWF
jgi:magnesium-transporting ATPase (P-type)